MKNSYLSILLLLILFSSNIIFSQNDARQLPYYLKFDNDKSDILYGKHHAYIRGDVTLDNTKYPLPDNMLSENGFKLINISGTQGSQDETWITLNPKNPLNIVGSSNNIRYNHSGVGYKMAAYYTLDGGKTWAISTTPSNVNVHITASGNMTNFDPGLAFDTKGNLYYCYGFAQVGSNDDEGDNGVFVNKSTDGGKTWDMPVPVALENAGTSGQAFHDRYSIATDVNASSPYKDRIYITWQRFKQSDGVMFAYSSDYNENWTSPLPLPGSSSGTQAPMPAVGPNGEVYVAWRQYKPDNSTDMMFQRSTDGGKNWLSSSKTITNVKNLGTINSQSKRNVLADKQSIRVSSCPYIIVDNSSGPRRGTIYMVCAGKDADGNSHTYLSTSTNKGDNWNPKVQIDDNTIGTDVFFPSVSVDPVTGMISIFYYSSQNDSKNQGIDAYLAVSFDGLTFKILRLTPNTWYIRGMGDVSYQGVGNYYWGDYSSITSYNGKIYPCFWMPNSPTSGYNTVTAYTAEINDLPLPPQNVSFKNDYLMPTKVELNWIDPSSNRLGGPLGAFKIVIYKGINKIAEVDPGVRTYTDNSAIEGQQFTYNLITKTSDGKESELVSISGIAGGSAVSKPPTELTAKLASTGITVSWKNPNTHDDGSVLNDFSKINIYMDGVLSKEIPMTMSDTGKTFSELITLPTEKFYKINLVAVTDRNGKLVNSSSKDTIYCYAGAPLTTLNESFDDVTKMIPTYLSGATSWGITSKAAESLNNSFTDSPSGNYPNGKSNSVVFAPVVIQSPNLTLSFSHIALIESGDFGIISVSTDLKTWNDIVAFDKNRSTDWKADVATSTWFREHRTLSTYTDDTLYIRFSMTSSPIKSNDGWYIDNLTLDSDPNSVDELSRIYDGLNLLVSPNPANDITNLDMMITQSGNLNIDLYDILGNQVNNIYSNPVNAGKFYYSADLSSLVSGVYQFRVTLNGVSKTFPIIINK